LLVSIATRANDLILYDRGYPAFWLLALHRQEQRRFCARMLLAFSREVSAFVASGKNSEAVLFTPGPHARQHYQTYGLATDPIPLRLIRMKLKSGEIEGLATLLLEEQTYPSAWFKHLYHLRWGNVEMPPRNQELLRPQRPRREAGFLRQATSCSTSRQSFPGSPKPSPIVSTATVSTPTG